jgi:hypothetical protein
MRHRPYYLRGAGFAVVTICIRRAPKIEGARNAGVHNGPADLDASRHRGLSKSVVPAFALSSFGEACHKSAGSPASRARCLRFAPHRPRWTDLSGALLHEGAYPPLWGPDGIAAHLTVPNAAVSGAPVTRGWRAGTMRLGPPIGFMASHLQRPQPATAPRPTSVRR